MKEISQEHAGVFPDLKHDEAAITSPGALLRDRRLALQLNEWDIAREMRLQTQYILDLEADNFDAFSSLAFVRGYLRGYAKLVGIAERDVMQLFNQLSLQEKVTTSIPKYITHDKSYGDRYWRWMGLAVVVFIVVSLVLWWQNSNSSLKSLSGSVNTTLSQVSTLQHALQTEKENIAAATPDQVSGTLGASADLLTKATAASPAAPVALTPAATSVQNNMTVPSSTAATVSSVPATTPIATPTMTPVIDTPPAAMASSNNADATTSVAKPQTKHSQSNLSSAHAPTVDGQAPRLGED
ncbi:MAG: integral rane protein [Gammaproteobacteria bacterium]|jgi:cytoskeleton protein RodZ|nr:integral rane protein [Gammaproteobacteria bacterium]